MIESPDIHTIPPRPKFFRGLVSTIYGPFLPYEISDQSNTTPQLWVARNSLEKGNGLIIAHTHLTKGDPPRLAVMIYHDPVLGSRELVIPTAYHQVKGAQSLLARLLSSENVPVITAGTRQRRKEQGLPEITRKEIKELMETYFTKTTDTLRGGGIALIAPQGTRQPKLESLTSAISTLVNRLLRAGVQNLAVLFVGVEIPKQQKLPNPDSINHGLLYRLNIGNCFSLERLLREANGKISQIDAVVKKELIPLVAPSYLSYENNDNLQF